MRCFKKNTPTTPDESNKETLDSLAIAAFKDLVDSIQSEIKPFGPGTRRYMVGRHVEEPIHNAYQLPSGRWASTHGVQEWLTPEPLHGPALEKWLTEYAKNHS